MHICVEHNLKKGEYYIFCDVNYRYLGNNHGYNITSYGEYGIPLENLKISNRINISDALEKVMFSYCKVRNIKPNKYSQGIETYSQNYSKDIPFMLLVFNNTSNNYYQANIEAKARGTTSLFKIKLLSPFLISFFEFFILNPLGLGGRNTVNFTIYLKDIIIKFI